MYFPRAIHREDTRRIYRRLVLLMPLRLVLLSVGLCCAACAGRSDASTTAAERAGIPEHEPSCARNIPVVSPYRMPLAEPVSDPEGMKMLDVLPPEARRTARAAGLEPLLLELMRSKHAGSRNLELRHELTLRLLAFDSQLTSLSFETECTRRHIADIADDLDGREAGRQLFLATTSLVVGAGTGISAGVLDLAGSQSIVSAALAVAGGVVVAGLGVTALSVPRREVVLDHHHNLLRPIVTGSDPEHFYPTFVFRMLTAQYPGDDTTPSVNLRADFDDALRPYSDPSHVRAIVYGDGGAYTRSLLASREHMLHQLQFAVQGVARSLELLDRALVRLLVTPSENAVHATGEY